MFAFSLMSEFSMFIFITIGGLIWVAKTLVQHAEVKEAASNAATKAATGFINGLVK